MLRDWTRAGATPDPELLAALNRLVDTLHTRYATGALTVEQVGAAHLAIVMGEQADSESYRRSWLVAALEQGDGRQLRTCLTRFVAAGVLVRLPKDAELSTWLARSDWGAYRQAAELSVACGWEGARDVEKERGRFKAAWAREREHFEPDDGPDPDGRNASG